MKINFRKTDANLYAAGLTRQSWTRTRFPGGDIAVSTVHRIFNEPNYPDGKAKTAVIEKLREEKFLVEEEESAAA